MAKDAEESNYVCWQCSDFLHVFPELMCTINNLKIKKQRTDEDSVLEKMIANGNSEITTKDM